MNASTRDAHPRLYSPSSSREQALAVLARCMHRSRMPAATFHSGSSDMPCRSIFVFRLELLAKTSNYLVTLTNFLFESFRLTHHGFQIGG
jgi:hypothetical protein